MNVVLAEQTERLQRYKYVDNDADLDSKAKNDNLKERMDPLVTKLKLMSKELDELRRSWTEKKGLMSKCIDVEKYYDLPVSDEMTRLRVSDGGEKLKGMIKVDEKAQRNKDNIYKDVQLWFEKRMRLWEETHPKLLRVDNMSNRLFKNNVLGTRLN